MQYLLFCKDINVMHFQKILLSISSKILFKNAGYFGLSFHLEGFIQHTSDFRLQAHILYLRVRKQKAVWKLWLAELVNRWFHCRVVCLTELFQWVLREESPISTATSVLEAKQKSGKGSMSQNVALTQSPCFWYASLALRCFLCLQT